MTNDNLKRHDDENAKQESLFLNSSEEISSLIKELKIKSLQLEMLNEEVQKLLLELDDSSDISETAHPAQTLLKSHINLEKRVQERTAELIGYVYILEKSKQRMEKKIRSLEQSNLSLQQSEERLLDLHQKKDNFFYIIGHDLRNPAMGILTYTDFLKDKLATLPREDLDKFVHELHISAKTLNNLLANLLSWGTFQSGHMKFSPADISLYKLAYKVKDLLTLNAQNKGIALQVEIEEDLYAYCDEEMLFSVLQNLVNNAIKFTNAGGTITIRCNKNSNVKFCTVSVSDTGIGIPDTYKNQLLRADIPFSSRGTAEEKGTGLGLMLCKNFVEKNNGSIWFESREGEGSTFYVNVPVADRPARDAFYKV